MTESKEAIQYKEQEDKLKIKEAKKIARRAAFVNKMKAGSTAEKMFIWLRYKWFDSILFYVTLILTGTLLIIAGRILWEIAKAIFSISL
jgi:hypothetical protein